MRTVLCAAALALAGAIGACDSAQAPLSSSEPVTGRTAQSSCGESFTRTQSNPLVVAAHSSSFARWSFNNTGPLSITITGISVAGSKSQIFPTTDDHPPITVAPGGHVNIVADFTTNTAGSWFVRASLTTTCVPISNTYDITVQ